MAASELARLRLVSYNVKRFMGPDGECTIEAIGRALANKLEPTVVCLNEVDIQKWPDTLDRFGKALGASHIKFFGHVRDGNYGNAICSTLPLDVCKTTQLDGGSSVEFKGKVHRIVRGLLVCSVDGSPAGLPRFIVASTHLDHMNEGERRVQLAHVRRELEALGSARNEPVVLCGDLNALKRGDYEDHHWKHLEDRHQERGWAPPAHGCLDELEHHGFVDCFHHLSQESPTASVENPLYRIDYCFARSCMMSHLELRDAFVAREVCASDHFPIVVDFSPRSGPDDDGATTDKSNL
ncbi:DNA-apurinic or apyrimidinic site lyase [Hondaea fermentalgiana]|uniref:DNA-apurinic or apyrimidinic site lyase n=1 Tax=Hondaea fermentalgiana TaxID=2315210 RepID=A0A2R5G4I0_9STRA|nr:DNA-apurinic or apyrimidinic site lyase [Hondaea fermentalgiana]|eukprot:GBG25219.1 DNA-apurinic or apyrimidinic site lyase [Hondaea fermentalgiana]